MRRSTKIRVNNRIIKAKITRSNSINLNGLGLTSEDLAELITILNEKLLRISILNLRNNNIRTLHDSIKNLDTIEFNLERNPLYLSSLLELSTLDDSQRRLFSLDQTHEQTLDQIIDTNDEEIALSVANAYPQTSVDEFNTLLNSLSTNQKRGIIEFELPLNKVGVGIDDNGILSSNLPWEKTNNEPLYKRFDEMAAAKLMEIEEDELVYLKEYLKGVFFYDLSENQINKLPSIQAMRKMYKILEEKKGLNARNVFDNNIRRITKQQTGGTAPSLKTRKNNDFDRISLEQEDEGTTPSLARTGKNSNLARIGALKKGTTPSLSRTGKNNDFTSMALQQEEGTTASLIRTEKIVDFTQMDLQQQRDTNSLAAARTRLTEQGGNKQNIKKGI